MVAARVLAVAVACMHVCMCMYILRVCVCVCMCSVDDGGGGGDAGGGDFLCPAFFLIRYDKMARCSVVFSQNMMILARCFSCPLFW